MKLVAFAVEKHWGCVSPLRQVNNYTSVVGVFAKENIYSGVVFCSSSTVDLIDLAELSLSYITF
jgi:hypothetical protein